MGITRESVLEYAQKIPGLGAKDNLFAALYRSNDSLAEERCAMLLSEFSSIPDAGARQRKMLQRLRTMIRLLQQEGVGQEGESSTALAEGSRT